MNKENYNRHFLGIELLISIVTIILTYVILRGTFLHTNSYIELYVVITTIAGSMFGFVLLVISLLLVLNNTEKLHELKRSKHYRTIYTIFMSTIKYLAITIVVGLLAIILNSKSPPWLLTIMFYAVLWTVWISSLRLWRCVWVTKHIINIIV